MSLHPTSGGRFGPPLELLEKSPTIGYLLLIVIAVAIVGYLVWHRRDEL